MQASRAKNMSLKTVRVFVGNLPPDTMDDDVQILMKKYATVLSVEIKRRANEVFAFVDLKDLTIDLDTCFQELSRKQWKGQRLKVQLARESFLQRLARERLESNVSVKEENVSPKTPHNIDNFIKCPDPCNNNVVNTLKKNYQKTNGNDIVSTDSNDSNSDSSDSETLTKGGLRMFCGTAAIFENKEKQPQKFSKLNSSKISTNKINEEIEILEKFEMFDGVWKDEPTEIATEKTTDHNAEKKQKVKQASCNRNVEMQENESSQMDRDLNLHSAEMPIKISQIKQAEAEERRLKAIADRKKEILNKKHVIQFALASVDSCSNVNRPNKKILFTDDDSAYEEEDRNCSSSREPKLTLFSDDEMEQERDNKNDFRIRKHYEGEKGQSLLSLQARYGNDKRFTLDERFIESDGEQEVENEVENDDTQAEREKLLRILGNVLGEEIPDSNKTKPKHTSKLMLRYDPSKPDHTKFEIKKDSNIQKSKKKKTIENESDQKTDTPIEVVKTKEETIILPVVSKERYYQISETLRETLESKDQKFSLSATFGDEIENDNEKDIGVNLEAKPIIGRKEWPLKPFQNDSSTSEDETNDQNVTADYSSEHNVGVRQESLFFERNDARFAAGLEFINFKNEQYVKNFDQIRHRVRNIIKHKVQNHRKNSERWRKKYGSRMKNLSSGRHRKTNFRR